MIRRKIKPCRINKYGVIGHTYYYDKVFEWGFQVVNARIASYGLPSRHAAKKALLEEYKKIL